MRRLTAHDPNLDLVSVSDNHPVELNAALALHADSHGLKKLAALVAQR